ncbi:MAG: endonuclease III [Candidatus Bipolaricaulis sp.]|nr:endonuclease III [Candidatus Bipolaricaulis sp.]
MRRLRETLGPPPSVAADPLVTLVLTILSQNTTDINRDRAYASLTARFRSFDEVADADIDVLSAAISTAGLQCQKAASIRAALQRIRAQEGRLDLSFLERMPTDAAFAWLLASPGVGEKTASIVLLFAFGRPVFPVDTHIRRVLTRVGWITAGGNPHRKAQDRIPQDPALMKDLHLLLIRLGRTMCRPRRPDCDACPLRIRCAYGAPASPRVSSLSSREEEHAKSRGRARERTPRAKLEARGR